MVQVRSVHHLLALSDSDLAQLPIPPGLAELVCGTVFYLHVLCSLFGSILHCTLSLNLVPFLQLRHAILREQLKRS